MRWAVALGLVVVPYLPGCGTAPAPGGPTTVPDPATRRPIGTCSGTTPATVAACVDPQRYAADVERIAQPRPPGSLHHVRVQAMCAEVLERHGYEVTVDRYDSGANVVGVRPGDDPAWWLFGAHYDHIPGCDGADDNASGVAAVLELARVLADVPSSSTIAFACWDEEERGLRGSRRFARRAASEGPAVALYVNFDAIAYTDPAPGSQRIPTGFGLLFPTEVQRLRSQGFRGDFITLVADPRAAPFARRMEHHAAAAGLSAAVLEIPTLLRDSHLAYDLERSDHASWWDVDVPAIMVTDTAEFRSPAYHCRDRPDDVRSLDLAFATSVVAATAAATVESLTASP